MKAEQEELKLQFSMAAFGTSVARLCPYCEHKIGPVNLSGMTVSAANDDLKNALNKIYNGLNNTTDPTSDIRLTLGNIRTIQINVMGDCLLYTSCIDTL